MPKERRVQWIMDLQQYNFNIKHRPGKQNANADALSRMPEKVAFYLFEVKEFSSKSPSLNNDEIIIQTQEIGSEDDYKADSEDNEDFNSSFTDFERFNVSYSFCIFPID